MQAARATGRAGVAVYSKSKDLCEKHGVSKRVGAAASATSASVKSINDKHHVTTKVGGAFSAGCSFGFSVRVIYYGSFV